MRIGVDAMGGDHAPAEQVKGALEARQFLGPDDRIVLYGRADAIEPLLADCADWCTFISVVDCPQAIGMDESPVEALRQNPESSIVINAKQHKAGEVDSFISAGNTGACVAAAQMYLRRLPGVHRPGITVVMPTFYGPVAMCDVGANVNCRPQHLLQYGIMAGVYVRHVAGVANPRVGLLSIGEEDAKGNALVKRTRDLLRDEQSVNFIGNVEGRDLFRGTCDVVICEGFVGNVCLKLMEGLTEGLFRMLGKELASMDPRFLAMGGSMLQQIRSRYDYNEYGGAPLLGVNGICIICHGSSNHKAMANAIRAAREFAAQGVNERITADVACSVGSTDE